MAVAGEGVDVAQRLVGLLLIQTGQRSDATGDGVGDEPLHERPPGLELWTQIGNRNYSLNQGEFLPYTNSTYKFEIFLALKNGFSYNNLFK